MSNPASSAPVRWQAVDFWRGYLLCTIFINHVPGNALEPLTQKNFGFSDSAEGFVFLSGVSIGLAYRRRVAESRWGSVTLSLMRRAARLYGVHVVLSLLGLAIFAAGAVLSNDAVLLQVHGRDLAVAAPGEMLLGVLSLGHQFGYFNILPLYILMIVIAPVLLWLGRASAWPMLATSSGLYLLAIARGWNMPTWPVKGTWFFDPFAWQLLMAVGIAVGLSARHMTVAKRLPLTAAAVLIVGLGAFGVTDGFSFRPGLEDWMRQWADMDKTTLGVGRLVHFCALAYLVYVLRIAEWFRRLPVFGPLCAIGRNSLWMFALLSLMAALGQVVVHSVGHTTLTDVWMMAGGLGALYGAAAAIETRRVASGALAAAAPGPAMESRARRARGLSRATLAALGSALRLRRIDDRARYGLR